jgi:hypothetical protein
VKHTVFLTAALLTLASRASAQTPVDPAANARVHFGPLAMSPALSLLNIGVDNNVFNEADQDAPKSDFTMTVQPKADLWLHFGRSILSGNITEDLIYYEKYENQRSANSLLRLGLEVPLTRLRLTGDVAYVNTKDRPGFEIDVRARHTELDYDGSVEIRALSKTFFGVKGRRQTVDFDDSTVQARSCGPS